MKYHSFPLTEIKTKEENMPDLEPDSQQLYHNPLNQDFKT
jgi:hypothetical protein